MNEINRQIEMVAFVANGLGNELLKEVAFVGGCTTGLFINDDFTKEKIRSTDDVDLIVNIVGYPSWVKLQETLRVLGFKDDIDKGSPLCRMKLGELKVDFMPNSEVLGFTNIWYEDALKTAQIFPLQEDLNIRLVMPVYFIATKLEAYKGRGKGDILASRDIEDILNLFDGREALVSEVLNADQDVKDYIKKELQQLLKFDDFEYAVQSTSRDNKDREALIFERIELLT